MEEKSDKTKLTMLVIALVIVLLIGAGYYVYNNTTLFKDKNETEPNNTNQEVNTRDVTEAEFEEIVTGKLKVLLNKTSLQEMTNQEKLRILINDYNAEVSSFSESDLTKTHQKSVIKDLNVIYEDIKDSCGTFCWMDDAKYTYDVASKTFTAVENYGHGGTDVFIAKKELVSLDKNNNIYTVKYRFVFTGGDMSSEKVWIYFDINNALTDAQNSANDRNKYDAVVNNDEELTKYFNEKYDEIKTKLPIYTYTFKVEDDILIITDFSVSK